MKTNKSILKRITVTKSGKLLRRKSGLNHFNAKAARRVQQRRHKTTPFQKALTKRIKTQI